ncbi:NFACT family protein [Hazenella sp. IB182353]|uniref:Rqc2 family fibronectin-binding protein n=1 Tax=Polycladospora coralii TaxID=2771432 RepID=UPI001747BFDB|nr:NFACT RNA binding domain-containing protein [Polycladospora coralii]MBS7530324.1 NFACT family protein [Polycladospora coralii]
MAFDGIITRAVVHECQHKLLGGRISKIYQPSDSDILFVIRAKGQNYRLLLSAHSAYARVHLSEAPSDNPQEPPMFCMLLRKLAEGAIIEAIAQVELERIIHIDFRARDELGYEVVRRLVIEIMGRHSNIILLERDSLQIRDAIKRVSPAISQYRQVLPGATYKAPPNQNKLNPLSISKEAFISGFDYNGGRLEQQIVSRFMGISPLIAREITEQAALSDRDALWTSFTNIMSRVSQNEYEPTILISQGKQIFAAWPLRISEQTTRQYPSISQCLEVFYQGKADRDRIKQQTQDLIRKLKNELDKNRKKIKILQAELKNVDKAEAYRIKGELITAHIYQISRGQAEITLPNFYEENTPEVKIHLDPARSPADNAQRYFKKYNKLKASKKWNEEQIEKAASDIQYLESVWVQLENASVKDIEQIREELQEEGWLKRSRLPKKRNKKDIPQPTKVITSTGIPIFVGRNNKQNDYVTHQLASSADMWLHTKDIPGSHVVIRSKEVDETTLQEAAMLAAYFSKARQSSQVPVDFTLVKHVKKPSGARPGFVIYENQQTVYVTPNEEHVLQLLKNT